jgi:hypothetical protein
MSSQPLTKELEDLKKTQVSDLSQHMRRALNQTIMTLSIPQGLESAVEIAVGIERRPILIKVLEDCLANLKAGAYRP